MAFNLKKLITKKGALDFAKSYATKQLSKHIPPGLGKGLFGVKGLSVEGLTPSAHEQMHEMLGQWHTAVPVKSYWGVYLNFIPQVVLPNVQLLEEYRGQNTWEVEDSFSRVIQPNIQTNQTVGCMLAREIKFPGEKFNASASGPDAGLTTRGGNMPLPIGGNRDPFRTVSIAFLETHGSFVDFVIRPWLINAAHFGLVARPDVNIKTNITMFSLAKTKHDRPMTASKVFTFYNAVPVSVDDTAQTHDDNSFTSRPTEWIYDSYTVQDARGFNPTFEAPGTTLGVDLNVSVPIFGNVGISI